MNFRPFIIHSAIFSFLLRSIKDVFFLFLFPYGFTKSKPSSLFLLPLFCFSFAQWPEEPNEHLVLPNTIHSDNYFSAIINTNGEINLIFNYYQSPIGSNYEKCHYNKLNNIGEFQFGEHIPIDGIHFLSESQKIVNSNNNTNIIAFWDYQPEYTVIPNTWDAGPVRLQKIDNSGNFLWENIGIPIGMSSATHYLKGMVKDNQGGVIVSFIQRESYFGDQFYMLQHFNSNGYRQYGLNGINIDGPIASNAHLLMVENEEYFHQFNFGSHSKIEKRNLNGEIIWEQIFNFRMGELIYHNNFLYFVHFIPIIDNETTDDFQLFLNKIDELGNHYWGEDGILLDDVKANYNYSFPLHYISINGDNSISFSWEDNIENGEIISNINFQIIEEYGNLLFDNPILINAENNQNIFVWYEDWGNGYELFTQKYNLMGSKIWDEDNVLLTYYNGEDLEVKVITDSRHGAIMFIPNSDSYELYAMQLSYFGNLGEIVYPGDISNDETVNVIDVLLTIENCILSDTISENCSISDLIQDNEYNVLDVLLIVQIILEEA